MKFRLNISYESRLRFVKFQMFRWNEFLTKAQTTAFDLNNAAKRRHLPKFPISMLPRSHFTVVAMYESKEQ